MRPQASQEVLLLKNPPANSGGSRDSGLILGQEDSLEEEMATHSSTPAWRIPWTVKACQAPLSMELQRINMTEQLSTHTNENPDLADMSIETVHRAN